jgi:hypothetical protein
MLTMKYVENPLDYLTLCSHRLTLENAERTIAWPATGFTVEHENGAYLITNWHVLAGRNPQTGAPLSPTGAVPATVAIDFHASDLVGRWRRKRFRLHDDAGSPLWREHPSGVAHPKAVDVVALKIDPRPEGIVWRHFPVRLKDVPIQLTVTSRIHVIGFPLGLAVGDNMPIWIGGQLANDPFLDHDRRPAFLVDARTREGMSGSPVIGRSRYIRTGKDEIAFVPNEETKFLGVYAGRVHRDADIGFVWRSHVLNEVLTGSLDAGVAPGRFNPTAPRDDAPIEEID